MRALILTNEFPPTIYGGAGVHVDELTRHLRPFAELDIRTFGAHAEEEPGWRVRGYPAGHDLAAADDRLRLDDLGIHRSIRAAGAQALRTPGIFGGGEQLPFHRSGDAVSALQRGLGRE